MEAQDCQADSTDKIDTDIPIKEEDASHVIEDIKTDIYDANELVNLYDDTDVDIKAEFSPVFEQVEVAQDKELISETLVYEEPLHFDGIKSEDEIDDEIDDEGDDEVNNEMGYYNYNEGSLDSEEAQALNNVEACLRDDIDVKNEYAEPIKTEDIKEEMGITVTETSLISNKVINTTSTITNAPDGLIQSQTTKTLVMEIHPMVQGNVPYNRIEEKILSTNYDNELDDSFQLNSITGDVLTLEQEAYGLLKTDHYHPDDRDFYCHKCDKEKEHLKVKSSMEKRAVDIMNGLDFKMEDELDYSFDKKPRLDDSETEVIKKEGYECSCGEVYKRKSRMLTCLRSHEMYDDTDCFSCNSCTRQFKDKQQLNLHRKRLHRKRFPCKFCPTDYETRKELFKHLQIHQKVQLMEYKVITEVVKGKQKLICFMCSKSFSDLSELKCHIMDEHKEPYVCQACDSSFTKIIDFCEHTKSFHPEVEGQSVLDVLEAFSKLVQAWKCDECNLQFYQADKFAKHQLESHGSDSKAKDQFQCDDCLRVFVSQKGLTSHRRIHHNTPSAEETEAIQQGVMCVECRKICKDMDALTSHMRFHSPDRKYPCKFCDFRFATPEKRKAHAELHTGDMKYVCFICEYQCSSENRLQQHKLSVKHANMKAYLTTGKPIIDEPARSDSKETCKKRRDSSSEDEEAVCDVCGQAFRNEDDMLEHKQTHPFIEFPNEDKPTRIFFK
ncbi:zinc finger protein 675-like [Danaus plexippus]|uniref:zinc finger protein 675-like n=1 Tax=Danaus plexippus TaxID=13037 RepID=UPI002AB110DD|nr:zinc finger protein 675-like [Danaus plexippus]